MTFAVILFGLSIIAYAPSALAAAPNLSGTVVASGGVGPTGAASAQWLALKRAYRIRSGVQRNQRKGTVARMYVTSAPAVLPKYVTIASSTPCSGSACSYELSTASPVSTTYEPSDGCNPNFKPNSSSENDDHGHAYCQDTNFFDLCGPGAADIALWYWPAPPSLNDYANVVDPRHTATSTSWNGYDIDNVMRMRGYMAYLAWLMKANGWTQPGLMEQYAPGGVRLQEEEVAMNYEETNHTNNSGFYTVQWHYDPTYNPGGGTATTFHTQVVDDLYYSNVPVVVEVNANLMPNWPHNGGQTLHFITVIGYNDNSYNASDGTYGTYYYTDTCAYDTHCGSNYDGGVRNASYNQMWSGIMGAPYSPSTGDGGWIW